MTNPGNYVDPADSPKRPKQFAGSGPASDEVKAVGNAARAAARDAYGNPKAKQFGNAEATNRAKGLDPGGQPS